MSTPYIINVDDYLELSIDQRYSLDEWLSSIGGKPSITRELRFYDGYVIAEEYCTEDNQLIYDNKLKDVVTREMKYKFNGSAWSQETALEQ